MVSAMKHVLFASTLLIASAALPSVACAEHAGKAAPGLYATKAEAEAAAKDFHCTGAHQMGDQWMPCAMHPAAPSSGAPAAH